MTEHPILFSAAMVKANLEGRKSQTRRLVTPRNSTVNGHPFDKHCAWPWHMLDWQGAEFRTVSIHSDDDPHFLVPLMGEDGKPERDPDNITRHRVRPRWSVGDRLWGKETFSTRGGKTTYRASIPTGNLDCHFKPWRPSIFMRREQSRLILDTTEIRGQRLQEISAHDAIAEGIEEIHAAPGITTFRDYLKPENNRTGRGAYQSYETLWDSINKKKAPWASNPLVWAITYKPAESEAAA